MNWISHARTMVNETMNEMPWTQPLYEGVCLCELGIQMLHYGEVSSLDGKLGDTRPRPLGIKVTIVRPLTDLLLKSYAKGSVCKVITQDTDNFDEEIWSLASARWIRWTRVWIWKLMLRPGWTCNCEWMPHNFLWLVLSYERYLRWTLRITVHRSTEVRMLIGVERCV